MSNVLPDTRPECGVAAAAVHGGKIYPFREWLADTADFTRTLWHELLRYLRFTRCRLPREIRLETAPSMAVLTSR
jgi:hypothetical protein